MEVSLFSFLASKVAAHGSIIPSYWKTVDSLGSKVYLPTIHRLFRSPKSSLTDQIALLFLDFQ